MKSRFFHQRKNVYCSYPANLQKYLMYTTVATKSVTSALTNCYARISSHPTSCNFIMGWIPVQVQCSGQFDKMVVKITWSVYRHNRWLILTIHVMLLVRNLSFHVTKQMAILRTINILREEMQVPSNAWILHFTRYRPTVATFFRCGGQVQNHICRISSRCCVPKLIQISLFWTELFKTKRWPLLATHCIISQKLGCTFCWHFYSLRLISVVKVSSVELCCK